MNTGEKIYEDDKCNLLKEKGKPMWEQFATLKFRLVFVTVGKPRFAASFIATATVASG